LTLIIYQVNLFRHMASFEGEKKDWAPPPKIEDLLGALAGNKFAGMNSATAGARNEEPVPEGSAPVQLYSLFTPNGEKVGILFEELGIEYDAWTISIGNGKQFTRGFVNVNPNSKIPACVDRDGPGGKPVCLFESGSILQYFAEKYQRFIPSDPALRAQVYNWMYWQAGGQGPFTGQFGHFMCYAPADKCEARDYGVSRYGMETQRLCSVLDQHLEGKTYLVGEEFTIADIMCYPWLRQLTKGYKHAASGISAPDFLNIAQYKNAMAWVERISARPAVQRGVQVCHGNGKGKPWLDTAA